MSSLVARSTHAGQIGFVDSDEFEPRLDETASDAGFAPFTAPAGSALTINVLSQTLFPRIADPIDPAVRL